MTVVQYQVNQPVSSGWGYYGYRNITIQAKPNYVPVSFHRIHFVQKESNHGERKRRNRKTSAACDNAGRNYQIVHKRVFSGDVFRVSDVVVFRGRSAVRRFGAAFSNAGFIGIPLVQMTLGEEAVFYVASYVAVLNILQWTYGVFIITRDKTQISLRKIVTNPIAVSLAAGLLLFFLPVRLPETVTGIVGTLASMNGPLAMIVLGAYLAQVPSGELFTDKLTYLCAAVRLLLIPVLTLGCLILVPDEYETVRLAVLLAAAAPVGSNVAIFAQIYHKEYTDAVKDVCLSTVFSILTMPLVIGLANYIW